VIGGGATIRGVVGQITWGYYTAARLEGYTVTRSKAGVWSLHGTVVLADPFKIKQRPLLFVAPHDKGEWRWPIDSIDLGADGGPTHLRAALGAPLEETHGGIAIRSA
jgi:hypothetical protein